MARHCFALDLYDDPELIERYKAWHRPGAVPRAVTKAIRAADITDMQIWLVGDRMVMIMETGSSFSFEAKVQADMASEDVQAWEHLMWEFQLALPFAGPDEKWMPMTRIYALGEQP